MLQTCDSCGTGSIRHRSATGSHAVGGAGLSNKEIALRLRISPRTVEIYRAWMMERMQARNLAQLVRMVMRMNQSS